LENWTTGKLENGSTENGIIGKWMMTDKNTGKLGNRKGKSEKFRGLGY
jgi:hypothetical protein